MKWSDRKFVKSINVWNFFMYYCNDYGYVFFGILCKKNKVICVYWWYIIWKILEMVNLLYIEIILFFFVWYYILIFYDVFISCLLLYIDKLNVLVICFIL